MKYDYLIALVSSTLISLLLTRWTRNLALARGQVDEPRVDRHLHHQAVPRVGGVAIWLTFTTVVGAALVVPKLIGLPPLLPTRTTLALLGPALIVFLTGLWDDLRGLGPYSKFGIQSLAALLLYFGGLGIYRMDLFYSGKTLPAVIGLPLTVLWVVLITNAFNMIDGLDGLAAGSALFSTLVLFLVSLFGGNSFVAFPAVVLAGTIVGFLPYNFTPATIFLGDSGSLFLGLMLSALALAGSQKASTAVTVAIPVLLFGLPILDVAIAVVRRFLSDKPLFHGDSEHIHHRLLKRGLSQRNAVLILYGVSALFGLLSLVSLHGGKVIALVLVVLGAGVCVGIQQLRYLEFSELSGTLLRAASLKRIIANDLHIRRATEALRACSDASTLCRLLTDTLKPMGFDGFSFQSPSAVYPSESFPPPFTREANGKLVYSWTMRGSFEPAWELRLELISSTGDKCGFFSVYKRLPGNPLLVDINLLGDGFHAALADAAHRVIFNSRADLDDYEQVSTPGRARVASASSVR